MRYLIIIIFAITPLLNSCGGEGEDNSTEILLPSSEKAELIKQSEALLQIIFDRYYPDDEIVKGYYDRAVLVCLYAHDVDPNADHFKLVKAQLGATELMANDRMNQTINIGDDAQKVFDKYVFTRQAMIQMAQLPTVDFGTHILPGETETILQYWTRAQIDIRQLEYKILEGMMRNINQ